MKQKNDHINTMKKIGKIIGKNYRFIPTTRNEFSFINGKLVDGETGCVYSTEKEIIDFFKSEYKRLGIQ